MKKKLKQPVTVCTQIGGPDEKVFISLIIRRKTNGRRKFGQVFIGNLTKPVKIGETLQTDNLFIPYEVVSIKPNGIHARL